MIVAPVKVLLSKYQVTFPVHPSAVKVASAPVQTVKSVVLMVGTITGFTVKTKGVDGSLVQPLKVQVTVYVLVIVGNTVIVVVS